MGVEWFDLWGGGYDCWKVGGKIFVMVGMVGMYLFVKIDSIEMVMLLIEIGVVECVCYLYCSWVVLLLDVVFDEIVYCICYSYWLVCVGLMCKV